MFDACRWHSPPDQFQLDSEGLTVVTNGYTDLWRETKAGFIKDDGHFFGRPVGRQFSASLRVEASYEHQYDQAGLMIRADERTWIKAGIELSDGEPQMGAILTLGKSDWSTGPYRGNPSDFWIRANLKNGCLQVDCSEDGKRWRLVRMCPFPDESPLYVGPMTCSPKRAGLRVRFSKFEVTEFADVAG